MTLYDEALVTEWQNNKHLPKEVRLEQDYDAMLDIVDFAMNTPADLAGTYDDMKAPEGGEVLG